MPAEDDIGKSTVCNFDLRHVNMLPDHFCLASPGKTLRITSSCGRNGLGRLGLIRNEYCLLRVQKQTNMIQQ